jgi:hypothetical protein
MTAEKAIELTHRLLAAVGVVGFDVQVCPPEWWTEYSERDQTVLGLCSIDFKLISLNQLCLDDTAEMLETIAHESAHALVGRFGHDVIFDATLVHTHDTLSELTGLNWGPEFAN